jgi:hypothetical protein
MAIGILVLGALESFALVARKLVRGCRVVAVGISSS